MAGTLLSPRRQAFLLTLFILGCAAFLLMRLRPRDPLEDVLGRLPKRSALRLYVDAPAAARAAQSAGAPLPWPLGLAGGGIDAIGFAVSQHELYLAATGAFGARVVEQALAARGIRCEASIEAAPCTAVLTGQPFLVRMDESGVLTITTDASFAPDGTLRGDDAETARQALDQGAAAWAAIDPSLLDQAMEDPPPNWINLQLVAKALAPARQAYLTLAPDGDGLALSLEALCADRQGAEELNRTLEGLNEMAIALVARDPRAQARWAPLLHTLATTTEESAAHARWTADGKNLAGLWSD